MAEETNRSRLDGVIDDVVREMMNVEGRSDLARHVIRSLDLPHERTWGSGWPAFAAAALALVVLGAGGARLLNSTTAPPVPEIAVVSGPPAGLEPTLPPPQLEAAPTAVSSARPAPPFAEPSSDSIFGPRTGQIGAASVTVTRAVRLTLRLVEVTGSGSSSRAEVALLLSGSTPREGRADADGRELRASAQAPEILRDGRIRVRIQLWAPMERALTVTLQPGTPERIIETIDPSGRQVVVEASAVRVGSSGAQR